MELSRIVLGLRAEPQSVGDSLLQLLTALEDEHVEERDAAEGYTRELARITINWMARSDEGALREAHQQINDAFAALGPTHPANRYVSDALWVGSQVRGIALVISTYLRTDNLAKSLGFLAGRRRESWRRALETMSELQRPVTAGDLVGAGLFDNVRTAANALTQLRAYGLVEKAAGSGTAIYALSWAGENAAKVLAADIADRVVAGDELEPSTSAFTPPAGLASQRVEADGAASTALGASAVPQGGASAIEAELDSAAAGGSLPELVQEMVVRVLAEALAHRRPALSRAAAPADTYARRASDRYVAESPRAPTAQGGEQEIEAIEVLELVGAL